MDSAEVKGSILAVLAHPDDETSVGPLLAKYAAAGHDVYLVSITSGQKGTASNPTLSGDELGAAREEELRCAAKCLGIHPPVLLGYQDRGISDPAIMDEITGRLRDIVEDKRPDVIITWGPDGITGHPDHRAASNLATEVFQQRPKLRHKPHKLYHVGLPESRMAHAPQGIRPLRTVSDEFITTVIEAGSFLDAATAAIRCHKTQWNAARVKELDEMNRKMLEGRIYLRLAISDVPRASGVRETDIFENLAL